MNSNFEHAKSQLWGVCFGLAVFVVACSLTNIGWSQDDVAIPPVPANNELRLPVGKPTFPENLHVIVKVGDEDPVVGRVYAQVANASVVVLPSGRLVSVPTRNTTETERPFQPWTKSQMMADLKERFPGFETKSLGKRSRYVYAYNANRQFVQATGKILETMYPGLVSFCKKQKIPVTEPEFPLVVVVFKTEQQFREYSQIPQSVAAYYSGASNFIVMYEQSEFGAVSPELAAKQSISTIAHEGVHQILHNIGVQKRLSRWPMWISEGLPEYFAPTEVGKRIRWKGVGLVNDLRLHTMKREWEARNLAQADNAITQRTVAAKDLDVTGYARSWAITHFLASKQRKAFGEYLRAVSALPPLTDPPPPGKLFEEHFGSGYGELDERLLKHLRTLPYIDPIANQTHYVVTAKRGVRVTVMVTSSLDSVRQFHLKHRGAVVNVRSFPNRVVAERFANHGLR